MKLKIVTLFFGFGAFFSQAQITLTESNTPHNPGNTFMREFQYTGITAPLEGTDMTWDYSYLVPTGGDVRPYSTPTRDGFTGDTRYNIGFGVLGVIQLQSEYYTKKLSDGITYRGSYKLPEKLGLLSFTGSPDDTLDFIGNSSFNDGTYYDLIFPATYGDYWFSDAHFNTNFLMTVAAFGLSETPGYQSQQVDAYLEVVGWGNLIMPSPSGASSISYEVLLVVEEQVIQDSVYLGGSPAPTPIMDAFGLEQGQISYQNLYQFYAEGFEFPLLTIAMSSDWSSVISCHWDYNQLDFANVSENKETASDLKLYPNPVKRNDKLVLTMDKDQGVSTLSIYNTMGQVIHTDTYSGQTIEWAVDASIETGIYYYTLTHEASNYTGKFVIIE